MIGTFVNGAAILVGGAVGLAVAKDLSMANQSRLKVALAALIVYVGFSLVWKSVNGTFGEILGQVAIIMAALIAGNVLGKLLRLQKALNRLGQYAKERFSRNAEDQSRLSDGFITCTLLFCVGPMAILGAIEDGLTGSFRTLGIKSVMDGLATMAFARTFGWGVMLSAIPVVAYEGSITLGARIVSPYLEDQALLDSINATGGLLIVCIALIVLELKKVQLADYLPSLIFAPLLTALFR